MSSITQSLMGLFRPKGPQQQQQQLANTRTKSRGAGQLKENDENTINYDSSEMEGLRQQRKTKRSNAAQGNVSQDPPGQPRKRAALADISNGVTVEGKRTQVIKQEALVVVKTESNGMLPDPALGTMGVFRKHEPKPRPREKSVEEVCHNDETLLTSGTKRKSPQQRYTDENPKARLKVEAKTEVKTETMVEIKQEVKMERQEDENVVDISSSAVTSSTDDMEVDSVTEINSHTEGSLQVHGNQTVAPTIMQLPFKNIDEYYYDSERHCAEYAPDIYQYLRRREVEYQPTSYNFLLEVQEELRENMREILVDWLVEVGEEYKLSSETLFLTKNYIDRYLCCVSIKRGKLQLLGITAMLIASKFEEMFPPPIDEFVYISDSTYKREEVIEFESHMLHVLQFEVAAITEKNFLRRYLMAAAADIRSRKFLQYTVMLSNYLIERTMQDYYFVRYVPSLIASSAICLSLHTLGLPAWTPTLQHYTGYAMEDPLFQSCLSDLLHLYQHARRTQLSGDGSLQAVNDKYQDDKYLAVSRIPAPTDLPAITKD